MISKVFCSFFVEEYILLFVKIIVFVRPMFRIFLWCLASNSNSSVEDKTYIMGREWLVGRSKSKTQSMVWGRFLASCVFNHVHHCLIYVRVVFAKP